MCLAGDLKGMVGRVVTLLADGSVDVMPDLEELKESIPLPANQLMKHFKVRQRCLRVWCLRGQYE